MPAEQMTRQRARVVSTIICSADKEANEVCSALAISGPATPINGNRTNILNSNNSFIGGRFYRANKSKATILLHTMQMKVAFCLNFNNKLKYSLPNPYYIQMYLTIHLFIPLCFK